jgi:hypothetical protein
MPINGRNRQLQRALRSGLTSTVTTVVYDRRFLVVVNMLRLFSVSKSSLSGLVRTTESKLHMRRTLYIRGCLPYNSSQEDYTYILL